MKKIKLKDCCILNRYHQLDANALSEIKTSAGNIKLLPSSKDYDWFSTEEKSQPYICDGEVITLGRARYANIKYYNGKFVSANNVIVESIDQSSLLTKYLYFYCLKNNKSFYIEGTTYPKFDLNSFNNCLIPLVSYNEQKTIILVLEKIQDLINEQENELILLDELIKSRFIEMFGDIVRNDKLWTTEIITKVCPIKQYDGKITECDGKIWLLNLDLVESNTGVIIDKYYVTKTEIGNSTITFSEDNVLYSKLRPYLNKVVVPDGNGYATSELIPFFPLSQVNKHYLAHALRSESFVNLINSKAGGTKMPRAPMDFIRSFPLPIPPIGLQNQFADFVSKVDKSKFVVQKRIELYKELLNKKMNEYFN